MNLQSNKTQLRPTLKQTLEHLSSERKEAASVDACLYLIQSLQNTQKNVLSFASTLYEINLWPLNKWLLKEGKLLLPKVENNDLKVCKVSSFSDLRLSANGIQEPCVSRCELIEPAVADFIILVPALGFDENRNRIGRGKGHYDKLLSKFPLCSKWGIGFLEQKLERVPLEEDDYRLDKVLFF